MDRNQMYGGMTQPSIIPNYIQPSVSFSFTPKDSVEPIPMGAVIKKVEKNISVRQIENGYIKSTHTCTCYEMKEKEEEGEESETEMKYHYETTEVYSAEKPMDVLKLYI
jgi:hypothetical protein